MSVRLYSRYRRKHDGFTVDVIRYEGIFVVEIPSTKQSRVFHNARTAAHTAAKSAQSGRAAWLTKPQ